MGEDAVVQFERGGEVDTVAEKKGEDRMRGWRLMTKNLDF